VQSTVGNIVRIS